MSHKHKFEGVLRPQVHPDAAAHGITAVEIRSCEGCRHDIPYVQINGTWVPLYLEPGADGSEILLA